ncbi:polyamine ABC transporter substrate-binding protein [uncultured Endozoicomonas sp.]|uniref:polyamine ABC transporter substrate-binding protein n=1 Tax=uncultured Endozoicomonas sp. TaxID=432652 RepID=UPI0026133551|nr:polyamine ABC transporter substrate-binding protein [uncultured Endozoicomonas sp.]
MKKMFIVAALLCAAQVHASDDKAEKLYFYNWTDYIAEDTVDNFSEQTGIDVVYDVYDSNEVLEGKLLSGRSGFDLVSPSHDFYKTQIRAGVYAPLDKSKLPNLKNLDPKIMKRISDNFDKENTYGIPYLWGTTGIGYNKAAVEKVLGKDAPVDSWSLILEPENMKKLQQCGVAFLDAPSEVLPSVMAYLGIPGDSLQMKDYKAAAAQMKEIAPYVAYYHSSRSLSDLANGDICVALMWSGDAMIARDRAKEAGNGIDIRYVVPKEGAAMWFDMLAIPNDAPHKDAAHKMLNYLMEPKVIADVTNYVTYSNPNPASVQYVEPSIAKDPGVFPTEETKENLFVFKELPSKLKRYITREWARIKSGS